jgi:hypothetical protein
MRAAVFVRQEHGLSPGLSDPEGGAGSRPDPLGLLRPVRHDASLFSGPSPFILRGITRYPFIPGHKWSGTIVGQEVGGLSGALGEYFSVPATAVIKLPATVGLDAAPLIEPATTVLRALHRTGCSIGDCVAVTGTGTLGLSSPSSSLTPPARVRALSELMRRADCSCSRLGPVTRGGPGNRKARPTTWSLSSRGCHLRSARP